MFRLATLTLALISTASAFSPMAANSRSSMALNANLVDTIAGLQGPGVVWGAEGIASGHEEAELKGYDNFAAFSSAIQSTGLAAELAAGEYTIFAPTDSAMAAYTGAITPELVKYHIVPGRVSAGSISADLQSISGATLKYERKFRKTFLNDAIVGQTGFGGYDFPVDVQADNGCVHSIGVVLEP